MSCVEKTRLAAEYEVATGKFAAAVTELRRRIGISPEEEYRRLDRAANEARVKSEQARLALELHMRTIVAKGRCISQTVEFDTVFCWRTCFHGLFSDPASRPSTPAAGSTREVNGTRSNASMFVADFSLPLC